MSSTKSRVSKIATVIIPVGDQDRQIEFYAEKLGLEKRVDLPFGGKYRWVEVVARTPRRRLRSLRLRPRVRRPETVRPGSACTATTSTGTTPS